MKKLMILLLFPILQSCPAPEPPYIQREDLSMDIVKFKNPNYKDYILTRKYPGVVGIGPTYNLRYIKNKPSYMLTDPLIPFVFEQPKLLSPWVEKGIWIELADDYYLCYWRWQTIFASTGSWNYEQSNTYYRYKLYPNYFEYNVNDEKEKIDNLYLMHDTWDSLPDTIFYINNNYDFLYTTAEKNCVKDENPISEHYVVTARSIFAFLDAPYNDSEKSYLGYHPLNDLYYWLHYSPYEGADDTNGIDSLYIHFSQLIKGVINSGRLLEYVEYDLNYNKKFRWGTK